MRVRLSGEDDNVSDVATSFLWIPWIGLGGAVAWLAPSALGLRRTAAGMSPWAAAFGSLVGAIALPALAPWFGLTSPEWIWLAWLGAFVGGLTGRFARRVASAVTYALLFGAVMLAQTWVVGGLVLIVLNAGRWASVLDGIMSVTPWVLGVSLTCGALIGLPINLYAPRPKDEPDLQSPRA